MEVILSQVAESALNNATEFESICKGAELALPLILAEAKQGETTTLVGILMEARERGFAGGLVTAEMFGKSGVVVTFNEDGTVVLNGKYYEPTRAPDGKK